MIAFELAKDHSVKEVGVWKRTVIQIYQQESRLPNLAELHNSLMEGWLNNDVAYIQKPFQLLFVLVEVLHDVCLRQVTNFLS